MNSSGRPAGELTVTSLFLFPNGTVAYKKPAPRTISALRYFNTFHKNAKEVSEAIERTDSVDVRTVETLEREISFTERVSRPATARVGHTGFITIARF